MGSSGKLIIVPTPLGNLGDMTERAKEALESADVIYAEDTRVTRKLLSAYGIGGRLERLDENLMGAKAASIVEQVCGGEVITYCSDAGMPGVSDPGLRLVNEARVAGAPVEVLPGPSAAVTAYVASGFTTPHFYFGGFLPKKPRERTDTLRSLEKLDAALIFYESPNRLVVALESIKEVFPHRTVAVCRELTKLHEEVVRDLAPRIFDEFRWRSDEGTLRGEVVIVIDAPSSLEEQVNHEAALEAARLKAQELAACGLRTKSIASSLREEFGLARNEAYDIAMELNS